MHERNTTSEVVNIDPLNNFCRCGHTFKLRGWQKLLMMVRGQYVYTCPHCHSRMTFKLIYHTVKVDTENMDEEIWENG